MPINVNGRLIGTHDSLSRMSLKELREYEVAMQKLLVLAEHPMIAQRLQQIYEEIDWRAADTKKKA